MAQQEERRYGIVCVSSHGGGDAVVEVVGESGSLVVLMGGAGLAKNERVCKFACLFPFKSLPAHNATSRLRVVYSLFCAFGRGFGSPLPVTSRRGSSDDLGCL